jgi:type I restriction enzyme, S subunit
MKQGWELKQLGDVCKVFNGSTPLRRKKEYWEDGEINWFTVDDIREQGRKISFTKQRISKLGFENSSLKILPPKSILLCCTASVGEYAMNEVELTTNQQFNGIVINDKDFLIPEFLFHFSSTLKNLLLEISGKTTIDFVSMTKVRAIPIPIPPLDEQKRIVAKLDDCFAAIDKARANVEKNLQNAKELFQSQLNQIFSQKGDGWEEKKLIDVNKFIDYRGRTPEKVSKGIRLITAKNVKMGYLKREPEEFINPDDYESWMTRGIPRKNDVLFTTEAPLANVALLDTDEKIALAQRIITFSPVRETLTGEYLHYCLQSKESQEKILAQATGATVSGIKSKLLKEITIYIPSLDIQENIKEKLDVLKSQTQSLESNYQQELDALDELKKSILQKAFNGEL